MAKGMLPYSYTEYFIGILFQLMKGDISELALLRGGGVGEHWANSGQIKKGLQLKNAETPDFIGRDDTTRTCDHTPPSRVYILFVLFGISSDYYANVANSMH